MSGMYPLRFRPILRRYLWGGRQLEQLGKTLGDGDDYAESWEIVDRGSDHSTVAAGPLAGKTLHELLESDSESLLGRHAGLTQFPLLIKFLDAQRALSLQVHPNDEQAARLVPPDLGKTEAWVILAAEPHSFLLAGLRRGVDRDMLARELARETCELCVERIEPKPGDCFYLPAGVVHALGPGLLVAEIQQASDTTFRLFDWNRPGPDGNPRELHVDEAMAAIDFEHGPVAPQVPQPSNHSHVEQLVTCDKFVLDRWRFDSPQPVGGDQRFHVLIVLDGAVDVAGDAAGPPLEAGGVVLLPAALGPVELQPHAESVLLDAYLP